MNKIRFLILAVTALFLATGCYFQADVATNEVAAQLDRNAVQKCVGPGVWTDMSWFSDLQEVSVATVTLGVGDPQVATKDNQLVQVDITIQARRKGDCASVKLLLANWSNLLDDEQLKATITSTAREGIKNGTREFTLTQLLDDRNGLATSISKQLEEDAQKYATEIVNVTIENVGIAQEYADVLQQTAKLRAEEDFQLRRQALIEQQAKTDLFEREQKQKVLAEQLKVEQAQTDVEVEIARRAGEIVKASNEIYATNEQAFELKRLELLKELFGDRTVYFLPEGTDPTMFFNFGGSGQPMPVPAPAQ